MWLKVYKEFRGPKHQLSTNTGGTRNKPKKKKSQKKKIGKIEIINEQHIASWRSSGVSLAHEENPPATVSRTPMVVGGGTDNDGCTTWLLSGAA
jgi:hypothetical protein